MSKENEKKGSTETLEQILSERDALRDMLERSEGDLAAAWVLLTHLLVEREGLPGDVVTDQ